MYSGSSGETSPPHKSLCVLDREQEGRNIKGVDSGTGSRIKRKTWNRKISVEKRREVFTKEGEKNLVAYCYLRRKNNQEEHLCFCRIWP